MQQCIQSQSVTLAQEKLFKRSHSQVGTYSTHRSQLESHYLKALESYFCRMSANPPSLRDSDRPHSILLILILSDKQ